MAKRLDTIWDIEPHTAAKHDILRRYLQAWIPILGSTHERIVYIDAFAGPGIYKGGEDGVASPPSLDAERVAEEIENYVEAVSDLVGDQ